MLLWQQLRQRPENLKFRRQHPVGDYVLDFYCAEAKVCIEVDGIAHDMGRNPEHDDERDAWLTGQRIEVFRIPAAEILKSPDDVADSIVRYCKR